MLQRFQISKLFNLYSYDLNLSNGSDDMIRFITGPNGYGKTTILRFISGIYQMDFSPLVDKNNPFEKLIMTIDDAKLTVERVVVTNAAKEEDGDEGQNEHIILRCKFETEQKSEWFEVEGEHASDSSQKGLNYQLFFKSHRCHFITDKRILQTNDEDTNKNLRNEDGRDAESPIMQRARAFSEVLKKHVVISSVRWEKGEALSEIEYYDKSRELEEKVSRLQKYHLIEGDVLLSADYQEESLRPFLSVNLLRLEKAIENAEDFLLRVETFERIITSFDFADKIFEINPSYKHVSKLGVGFRFVLQDADKTKLLNDRLSSGETHLIVMFYDLLFKAASDEMLFLIDEPELSFHLAWQKDFLDILQDICRMRKLQCVLATHSTDMFVSDFDITADLFESRIKE